MSFDTDCMSYPTDIDRSHYYMMMNQSYSPEFTTFPTGSPTYSVSSNSSASVMGSMRPSLEEDYLTVKSEPEACGAILAYNVLDSAESTGSYTRESLSPLPESPYDAYSHHFTTGPLLTPPASDDFCMGLKSRQPIEPYMNFYPTDPFKYSSPFDSNNNSMHCCSSPPQTCYSQNCYYTMPMPNMMYQNNNINNNNSISNNNTLPSYSTATSSPYYRHPKSSGRGVRSKHNVDKSMTDAQRRYKCTLCDKRFTRPSSLATHMHSHTGEVSPFII
jgi:hypothetical protein